MLTWIQASAICSTVRLLERFPVVLSYVRNLQSQSARDQAPAWLKHLWWHLENLRTCNHFHWLQCSAFSLLSDHIWFLPSLPYSTFFLLFLQGSQESGDVQRYTFFPPSLPVLFSCSGSEWVGEEIDLCFSSLSCEAFLLNLLPLSFTYLESMEGWQVVQVICPVCYLHLKRRICLVTVRGSDEIGQLFGWGINMNASQDAGVSSG